MTTTLLFVAGKTYGLTKDLILSWLYNADTRLRLLQELPVSLQGLLNERSLSSDSVELVFAMVVMVCGGYKPSMATLVGCTRNIEFAVRMRAMDPALRPFSVQPSDKHVYSLHAHTSNPLSWNDGSRIPTAGTELAQGRATVKEAVRKTGQKPATIRSHHNPA